MHFLDQDGVRLFDTAVQEDLRPDSKGTQRAASAPFKGMDALPPVGDRFFAMAEDALVAVARSILADDGTIDARAAQRVAYVHVAGAPPLLLDMIAASPGRKLYVLPCNGI